MSTILNTFRASGGTDVQISTLELACSAWPEKILVCNGFENQVVRTENGDLVTFEASGMDVALPKRSTEGSQELIFAIDNVRGKAQPLVDLATSTGATVTATVRLYLESDKSAPAERPLRYKVLAARFDGPTTQVTCGYADIVNTAWPRELYTANFAPGLKYIA